jgi:hypothetical protein
LLQPLFWQCSVSSHYKNIECRTYQARFPTITP